MQVKKVVSSDLSSTYCCIPPNSPYAEELPDSKEWFRANLNRHVEGYHLFDEDEVVGHIYYAMSDEALIPYKIEPNVACIYCTYLLQDYIRKGRGRMMFDYMKTDLMNQHVKGIVVLGTDFKEWMHYKLFLKQGFHIIKENPPYKTMYFPLTKKDIEVKALDLKYVPAKDKVEVTLFKTPFCPVSPYMYKRTRKVAQSLGDKVRIVELNGSLENMRKYGTLELLINGKIKIFGPASEDDVRKTIAEEIVELNKAVLKENG